MKGEPLPPISRDDDSRRRDRRLAAVERDVILHGSGEPCAGCGGKARLSGGEGCHCGVGAERLVARCLRLAELARGAES